MSLINEEATGRIIGAAIEVHRLTGAGLYEEVYEDCLDREMCLRAIPFARQVHVPLDYKGLRFDKAYRADFVVEESVVLELKVVEYVLPRHRAQVLTYMKLLGLRTGLLINFNEAVLKDGIHRFVL